MKSKESLILSLYKLEQTVFSAKEIALIWQEKNPANAKAYLKYYVDKGDLVRLRKGIYAKNNYDIYEAVSKIYAPSYISFETVLRNEGVIFQYYETIFAAGYLTREIELTNGQKISYRKLKSSTLLNPEGIIRKDGYSIASKERAFLDMIYIFDNYHFDNLNGLDWEKCFKLADIYESKKIKNSLDNYYHNFKNNA
ncbi:MAG: type IV toxin-antitoxin system AbiEi family antitoxin domain-containing protein [Parcubacteria group bacterium]